MTYPHKRMLSSLDIKGCAQILKSSMICVSPAIGLLLNSSSALVANLRRQNTLLPCTSLAADLFFQRMDSNGRRYGPVAPTNSQSQASYWLTPKHLGYIVGLAIRNAKSKMKKSALDDALGKIGISCNHLNGNYTGVSMERYRKIVNMLCEDLRCSEHTQVVSSLSGYALPLVLSLLWSKAASKSCLLDFLLAVEEASGEVLLLECFSYLRDPASHLRAQWIGDSFSLPCAGEPSELSALNVTRSCELLLSIHSECGDQDVGNIAGAALEHIAAAVALERAFKNPIRLGKFSYGDGKAKPDCVEVVVREVIGSLIFDPSSKAFCLEALPATASPALKDFFLRYQAGELQDTVPGMPAYNPSGLSAGQAWFDLCSELPGCEYLSETSEKKPYELRPTMSNVSRVLGLLLAGSQSSWKSFKDLQTFWNDLSHSKRSRINTTERLVSFRAPFSDTEKIYRETAVLSLSGGTYELEIELEDAHGLATVKHRRVEETDALKNYSLYDTVHSNWKLGLEKGKSQVHPHIRMIVLVLQSVVLSDNMLKTLLRMQNSSLFSSKCEVFDTVAHALLSSRWGEERRCAMLNELGQMSVTDGALSNSADFAMKKLERTHILNAMKFLLDHSSKDLTISAQIGGLLAWLIDEASNTICSTRDIAGVLCIVKSKDPMLYHHPKLRESLRRRPDNRILDYIFPVEIVSKPATSEGNWNSDSFSYRSALLMAKAMWLRVRLYFLI